MTVVLSITISQPFLKLGRSVNELPIDVICRPTTGPTFMAVHSLVSTILTDDQVLG